MRPLSFRPLCPLPSALFHLLARKLALCPFVIVAKETEKKLLFFYRREAAKASMSGRAEG